MAFPFLNNPRPSKTQMRRAALRPIRALPRAPSRPMRKMLFEPLEPRVLLSADDVVSGVLNTMQQGFDALYSELAELLENGEVFENYVPGFLTSKAIGDEVSLVSPTLGEALAIPVRVDSYTGGQPTDSGFVAPGEGDPALLKERFEYLYDLDPDADGFNSIYGAGWAQQSGLDAMDIDDDGNVTAAEAFGVLVLGQAHFFASTLDYDFGNGADDFLALFGLDLGSLDVPGFLSSFFSLSSSASGADFHGDARFALDVTVTLKRSEQVDLGYMADEFGIVVDPTMPGTTASPTELMVSRTFEFDPLILGFAGVMEGEDPSVGPDDFYMAAPEGMKVGVAMNDDILGTDINVGFLGTDVIGGDGFALDMHALGFAEDPSNPEPLGFPSAEIESSTGVVTAPDPADTFEFDHPIEFSLQVGTLADSAFYELTLPAGDYVDLPGLLAALQGVVNAGGLGSGLVTVDDDGGHLRFSLPDVDPAPAGFSHEQDAIGTLEADGTPETSTQSEQFSVGPYSFLLAVDHGTPVLIQVGPIQATKVDPDDADSDWEITIDHHIAAIDAAIDAVFGDGFILVDRNGAHITLTRTDAVLEITRTLTFDTVNKISIDELLADGNVFQMSPDEDASFTVDLDLKAKPGLKITGTNDPYEPEGTIYTGELDPFDQIPGGLVSQGFDVEAVVIDRVPGSDEPVIKTKYPLLFDGQMAYTADPDSGDPLIDPDTTEPYESEMLGFNVVNVAEMVGIINQLAIWFERLAANPLLIAYELPFADAALADLLAFGDMIRDTLLINDRDDGLKSDDNDLARLLRWVEVADDQFELLPWFHNVQTFVDRLDNILDLTQSEIAASYDPDPTVRELTFHIAVDHDLVPEPDQDIGIQVPLLFREQPDDPSATESLLAPLNSLYTEGMLSLTAEGEFELTLGIILGDAVQPLDAEETTLDQLNDDRGVTVNPHIAVTSLDGLDPIVGRLSSSASFVVTLWTEDGVVQETVRVLWSEPGDFSSFLFPNFTVFGGLPAVTFPTGIGFSSGDSSVSSASAEWNDTTTRDNELLQDLIDDVNTALGIAGLGDYLEAVAADDNQYAGSGEHDSGRIVLVAKSGDVQAFQLWSDGGNSASRELGLVSQSAATVSLVAPLLNQLVKPDDANDDIVFTLNIYRAGAGEVEEVEVTVAAADMADNRFFSDLVVDLNRALVDALGHEGDVFRNPDIIASRAGGNIALSAVTAGIEGFFISGANDAAKEVLGFDAEAWRDQLKSLGVDETAVDDDVQPLFAGVILRAKDIPADPFGRVAEGFSFTINGHAVNVDDTATQGNTSLDDLVLYLNVVINNSDAKGTVVVERDGQYLRFRALDPEISSLSYVHTSGAANQIGFGNDTYESSADLKVVANRDAPVSFGVRGEAGTDSLPAEFTVELYLQDEDDPLSWEVVLRDSDTIQARSLYDLAARINHAMSAGFAAMVNDPAFDFAHLGLDPGDNPLIAIAQGDRIVIGLKTEAGASSLAKDLEPTGTASMVDQSKGFTISAAPDTKAATDLFLVGGSGTRAAEVEDFLIVFSNGDEARISLSAAGLVDGFKLSASQNLQALFDAMVAQAGKSGGVDRLEVRLRGDGGGLELVDNTFDHNDDSNNIALFEVIPLNGSPAAQGLGILASDTTRLEVNKYAAGAEGIADGVIQGARIATVDVIQRVFIEDAMLSASIGVTASADQPDGAATMSAVGNYGFVGIKLSIGTEEELYQAEFSFLEDTPRLGLDELLRSVGSAAQLHEYIGQLPQLLTVEDHDSFDLELGIEPGFPASMDGIIDLSGLSPTITFAFGGDELGTLAQQEAFGRQTVVLDTAAEISVAGGDLGALAHFADLRFDDVLTALKEIAATLDDFQALDFLGEELPLIGVSIGELLNVAERFRAALQTVELNPAGGLQLLDQALRQGFGIPEFGDLSDANNRQALADYLENRGVPVPEDLTQLTQLIGFSFDGTELRFDLRLPLGFSQSRAIDLDLTDHVDPGILTLFGLDALALQGGAGLNLTGFLDTRLAFGIDLSNPSIVTLDEGDTSIKGGLSANATNLNFNAGIGPLGLFIRDGLARVALEFGLADDGGGLSPYFEGDIETTLPVFFPDDSTYIDDLEFSLVGLGLSGTSLDLPVPTVDFDFDFFSTIDFDALDPFASIPLMLDALDFFLMAMQDLLDGNVFGIDLPIIGDQLKGGSDFIDQLRRDVLSPIRDFTERAPELGLELIEALLDGLLGDGIAPDDVFTVGLEEFNIFELLGIDPSTVPAIPGLGLLKDAVTAVENAAESAYEWRFELGRSFSPAVDFGFDLGFPALGLELEGGLQVEIDWSLALGLGISPTKGAYLLVGGHDDGDAEFEFDVTVMLPGSAIGRLGFLQVVIENEGEHYTQEQPGDLYASFAVDVTNGAGMDANVLPFFDLGNLDAKIAVDTGALLNLALAVQFNTAILPDPVDALLPKMKADFILDWGFASDDFLSGDFDLANSLHFVGFENIGLDLGSFLGEFFGPFLGELVEITEPFAPVLEAVTTPIPVISHLAGRPITLVDLAEIFGEVDLGMVYAIADIVALVQQIGGISGTDELIIPLGDLTIYSSNPGGFGNLSAGDLTNPLFQIGGDPETFDSLVADLVPEGFDLGQLITDIGGDSKTAQLNKSLAEGSAPGADNFTFPLFDNPFSAVGLLLGQDITLVTYDLPRFHFSMTYVQQFPIWGPLWARLGGSIGLTIDLAFGYDTYGVRQFVESGGTNPLALAAGFHVLGTDQPDGQGSPVDHLLLMGEIFAGAEINLGIASAGVEGGLRLEIGFRLHDNDGDGKIRLMEIATNFLHELRTNGPVLAPVAIFDVHGELSAFLRAFIEILFFEASFEVTPPIVVAEFHYEFDRPPVLATERGDGSLLLNLGSNAEARLNGDTSDFGETIHVKSLSSTKVEVWSENMGVPAGAAQVYTLGANKTIYAYGGKGDDNIDLSELGHGIRYYVEAGPGDDVVEGGQAGGIIHGGLGDDELYGGSGNDLLIGGPGNDYIEGGDGDDWMFGDNGSVTEIDIEGVPHMRFQSLPTPDDGDDTIFGGNGIDVIFGGGGYDLIFGGADDDLLIGDGGYFSGPQRIEGGVVQPYHGIPLVAPAILASNGLNGTLKMVDVSQVFMSLQGADDQVYGGTGNDALLGGPGNDRLDGGSDNDVILGGTGNDTLYGGPGSDWLFGEAGDDIVFGYRDPHEADFDQDPSDTYGLAQNDIDNDGGDYIEGGDGNDFARGQGGGDRIHGNRGADILFGDGGDDVIGAGYLARPWVHADEQAFNSEAGGDIVFGGLGGDTIDGGTGGDLIYGDDGLVVYLHYAPAHSVDGFRAHNERGSLIRTDSGEQHKLIGDGDETVLIKAVGDLDRHDGKPTTPDLYTTEPTEDDGDDWISGGDANDIVFGGGGNDTMFGDLDPAEDFFGPRPTGNDVLIGDGGRVELHSRRFQAIEAVADEHDGNDDIFGNDGNDIAFGGGGQDLVFGFHDISGPLSSVELADSVDGISDHDIQFGDNGRVEFNPEERANRIVRMFTTPEPTLPAPANPVNAPHAGGNDEIYGQQGNDVIFGGLNNDAAMAPADVRFGDEYLAGGDDDDIIVGDQGEILFYAIGFLGSDWERMPWDDFGDFETADAEFAGHALWSSSYPLFLIRSWADNQGGSDVIAGERGADIIIGGTAGDEMYGDDPDGSHAADDLDDIMLGDNGEVWFNIDFDEPVLVGEGEDQVAVPNISFGRLYAQLGAMPFGHAIDLVRTSDGEEYTGGADTMSGNAGADVVFGGVNNGGIDYLYGDRSMPTRTSLEIDGDDVLGGDDGLVSFTYGAGWFETFYDDGDNPLLSIRVDIPFHDEDRNVLNLIVSFQDGLGDTDIISGSAGGDVAMGSTGDDLIYGDRDYDWASLVTGDGYATGPDDPLGMDLDGDDMLIGDNAYLLLTSWVGELPDPGERIGDLRLVLESAVFVIRTTDETDPGNTGGVDTIAGNRGNDIVAGGVAGDFLYGDAVLVQFLGDMPENGIESRQAVRSGFDGDDIMLGDNGALEWLSEGRLEEVEGAAQEHIDISFENPWLAAWAEFDGQAEDWDLDLTTLDMVTTEQPYNGARDWMWGGDANDVMFGGTDADTMFGDNGLESVFSEGPIQVLGLLDNPAADTPEGEDLMSGDHGRLYPQFSWLRIYEDLVLEGEPGPWQGYLHSRNFFAIDIGDHEILDTMGGEGDRMWGQGSDDIMLGQQGDDRMWGGAGSDDMIGGHNVRGGWDELGAHGLIEATIAGVDEGDNPVDVPFNDIMDGGSEDDVMAGDNAILWRRPDDFDPRFRALEGTRIYTTDHDSITVHVEAVESDNLEFAGADTRRLSPTGTPGRDVTLVDHDFDIEASDAALGRYGRDIMAGGADDDRMYGQLGDDLMQGDGDVSLDPADAPFIAWSVAAGGLPNDTFDALWFNIPERETDGDDSMEGNGGADLMFGGLGQDDMTGGSSSLHGLDADDPFDAAFLRPDGSDIMFGGAGIRVERNDWGEAFPGFEAVMASFALADYDGDGNLIAIEMQTGGHARDADYMMGDNANIYRLVGVHAELGEDADIADPGAALEIVWDGPAGAQIHASYGLLAYNYDVFRHLADPLQAGAELIKARAMQQLDYHVGGADYHDPEIADYVDGRANVTGAPTDNGAADFMHGEAGDDFMFGMTASDLMFGGAGDDDMAGGYGHDWMSGGTGQDGMLGDDGLIYTSRNSAGYAEPLHGIARLLASDPEPKYSGGNVLNEYIYTPGQIQNSVINVEHELKKTADLTPFSVDPSWIAMDDEYPDSHHYPFADDIQFGGWGSDWMHGGSGDDAMSGAEALPEAWVVTFDPAEPFLGLGYGQVGLPDGPWTFLDIHTYGTQNPGDVLAFNPLDEEAWKTQNRLRAGEFWYYDEFDPLRKIMLTAELVDSDWVPELYKGDDPDGDNARDFLLNFDPSEGIFRAGGKTPGNKNQSIDYDPVNDDGNDVIFGDNGNDWLVGGTGREHMYGGWGNDLLNANDDHDTNGGLNDVPDTHPSYEDIAYGGAGRDVLIANTGGDRLIDWVGEYNSYLVPFAPFGMATVSRTLQPFLPEYLYALALGDGIDDSRVDDGATAVPSVSVDPARVGEPYGELGLVLQKDFAWQAQTGAPADPQAGNIPGGKRDVLRSADFSGNQGNQAQGFMIDSGQWSVSKGQYQVEPSSIGGAALSVWHHDQYQPNYFEVLATVNVVKPIMGYKANAYIVFDYQSADDFKFAGLNGSTNKVEIGHKQGNTWTVLTSINLNVKHSSDYNLLLSVNGTSVILVVNNQHSVSYTFAPRMDADGILYNINSGMIGLGADNGRASIGNMHLLALPPQITHSASDHFDTAPALLDPLEGNWSLADGRLAGEPEAGAPLALASGGLTVAPSAVLQLETTFSTAATGGIVFDQYATNDFKWAAWSKATNQVQIGYHTARDGWVVTQSVNLNLEGAIDFKVTLKGTTVSVLVNNAPAISHAFNAIVTDGHFGLFATGGPAAFDHFTVRTDDPAFAPPESHELAAAYAGSGENLTALDDASLEAISQAAMNRWTLILGGVPVQFYGLQFEVADLGGLALARIEGNTVMVDEDAAGHGWFIDPTPYDDGEFKVRTAEGLRATPSSAADGRMDLLTVLMHELGHAIGYQHDASVPGATALMSEALGPGLRAVDFAPPGQASQAPALWSWDAARGTFVQDAAGWQNGRLFSYLNLATVKQAAADDWLTADAPAAAETGEDWLEFAPATGEQGSEASLIEWVGL